MRLDLPEAAIDARFPRLRGAECFSAVLEPGEALLIPAVYLHEVAALEPSVAVNNYFDSALVDTIAAIFVRPLPPATINFHRHQQQRRHHHRPPPPPVATTRVANVANRRFGPARSGCGSWASRPSPTPATPAAAQRSESGRSLPECF